MRPKRYRRALRQLRGELGVAGHRRAGPQLLRWTALLGGLASANIVAKTVRRRYLVLPGRLTRSGRRDTLHLPKQWPRQRAFLAALRRIRLIAIC